MGHRGPVLQASARSPRFAQSRFGAERGAEFANNFPMVRVSEIVDSLGRMAQKQQLVRRGVTDRDLTCAVRTGDVIRVRNGWYSTMSESSPELRAVRVGGRLTGVSAIAVRGGWVFGDHPLHVAINDNAARLRTQHNRHQRLRVKASGGIILHWESREQSGRGTATMVGLLDALERVVMDESFETAVAALDWAIHTNELDVIDFELLLQGLPNERRGIRNWVDIACESLPESLVRTRLRLSGHEVITQVGMGDPRSIDLVVDRVVAIEVDGEQYHRDRFETDRRKDVDITLMNLHALRPSARMVFREWDRFAAAVEAAITARNPHGNSVENSGKQTRSRTPDPGLAGWSLG